MQVAGARLLTHLNLREGAPLVILIPGWLGSHRSTYVVSAGQALWQAGFSTARINLRDHGDTAHLNEEMFHSAMIDEVIALIRRLRLSHGHNGTGLMGFSLGGNFALRIARAMSDLRTLAVCPAIEPADTMYRIDATPVYQRYFIRKWRRVWADKERAFGHRYDFRASRRLSSVSSLTDYFVKYHSPFSTSDEYFAAYDLSGSALDGVSATILAAADDPIIPVRQYQDLPGSLNLHVTERGGHGAYLESWKLDSWVDQYAVEYFSQKPGAQHPDCPR